MTNIGPLTTTFTPSAACLSQTWMVNYTGSDHRLSLYHSYGPPSTLLCYPPDFKTTTDAFYSPGVCPSGRTTACSNEETVGTVIETRATCCPKGYFCQSQTGPVWYSTLRCSFHTIAGNSWSVSMFNKDGSATFYYPKGEQGVQGYGVSIRWMQTDIATTAATSTRSTATPGLSIPSGTIPTNTNVSSSDSSGLSTGAKAGIGVGVALAALAFIGAVAFFLFNKRRGRSEYNTNPGVSVATTAPSSSKGNVYESNHQLAQLSPLQQPQQHQYAAAMSYPGGPPLKPPYEPPSAYPQPVTPYTPYTPAVSSVQHQSPRQNFPEEASRASELE